MSITTVARPAAPPRTLPPQWRRAFSLSSLIIVYVGKWFWAVIALCLAIAVGIAAWVGGTDASLAQFAQHGGIWFPFSLMIMLPPMLLSAVIVGGLTRDAFVKGTLLTAVGTAAGFSVLMVALLWLERWAFGALGWGVGRVEDLARPALESPPAHLWGLFLLYLVANVSGLLLSTVYYRYGALWGTVALPLTLAPIALVGLYGLDMDTMFRPWIQNTQDVPAWLSLDLGAFRPVLGLVLVALAAVAYARTMRTLAIHAKES